MKYISKDVIVAGCDEAGRGSLSGPVFAAAVILPNDFQNNLINDSKKLKPQDRLMLRDLIQKESISWAVAQVDNTEIDKVNILNASFLAMHKALDWLPVRPGFLLIDGNRFTKYRDLDHQCFIKGDAKYMSIAAASILAKTYRDEYMQKIHNEFPEYNWFKNKGYPTEYHRLTIMRHGITKYHRKTFRLSPHPRQQTIF